MGHRGGPGPQGRERRGVVAPDPILAQASMEIAGALHLDDMLRSLASLVVPVVADWYAVDLVTPDGALRRVAVEHQDPEKVARVRELEKRYPPDPSAPYGVHQVIRTGKSELVPEVPAELIEQAARDPEHLAILRDLHLTSYVVVPMVARDRILGAMTFVFAESGRRYDEKALAFAEDLAARAALAVDNIRLLDDLREAHIRLEDQAAALERNNEELEVQNEELQVQASELADALARVEEEHREKDALLASTAEGIFGVDGHGLCTFINASAARMLGLDPDQARGQDLHHLIHHTRPDGRAYPRDESPIVSVLSSGVSVRVDHEVLWRPDGTQFPVSYSASPVLQDGSVVGAVVAFADESERRAVEDRVQLLGRILDDSLNEIYMFDGENLCFVQVNRGGRENLGYSMDELRRMTPVDLKPEFTPEMFDAMIEPLRVGEEEALRFETIHLRKDGSEYPVEVNLQLSRGFERSLFIAVILDITERRRAEAEREELIRDLEEANRVKADFVSTMSHELRTPLNAVTGYAQLLDDGIPVPIPEDARSHVRRITLSARHLLQLIDEVLTFSKLEAGRESTVPGPIHLAELVDEVRAVLEPLAAEREIGFNVTLKGGGQSFVSDPKKLRQILLNLSGNAVKFTEPGGRVDVFIRAGEDRLRLEVADTGIGMTEDEQARAFDPFWQANQTSTRSAGGAGLGLAITRRFVDVLGGTLDLESSPGSGTRFRVTLPRLATETETDSLERYA
jgi:PAS domain S-box-containing protein